MIHNRRKFLFLEEGCLRRHEKKKGQRGSSDRAVVGHRQGQRAVSGRRARAVRIGSGKFGQRSHCGQLETGLSHLSETLYARGGVVGRALVPSSGACLLVKTERLLRGRERKNITLQ